jgi:hypothetical protein
VENGINMYRVPISELKINYPVSYHFNSITTAFLNDLVVGYTLFKNIVLLKQGCKGWNRNLPSICKISSVADPGCFSRIPHSDPDTATFYPTDRDPTKRRGKKKIFFFMH